MNGPGIKGLSLSYHLRMTLSSVPLCKVLQSVHLVGKSVILFVASGQPQPKTAEMDFFKDILKKFSSKTRL